MELEASLESQGRELDNRLTEQQQQYEAEINSLLVKISEKENVEPNTQQFIKYDLDNNQIRVCINKFAYNGHQYQHQYALDLFELTHSIAIIYFQLLNLYILCSLTLMDSLLFCHVIWSKSSECHFWEL